MSWGVAAIGRPLNLFGSVKTLASASPAFAASMPRMWANAHMLIVRERQRLSFGDRGQELPSPRLEQSLDGSARDAHLPGCLFLLLLLEIAEPHGLEFIQSEFGDLQLGERDPRGFEEVKPIDSTAVTKLLSSRHSPPSIGVREFDTKERDAFLA